MSWRYQIWYRDEWPLLGICTPDMHCWGMWVQANLFYKQSVGRIRDLRARIRDSRVRISILCVQIPVLRVHVSAVTTRDAKSLKFISMLENMFRDDAMPFNQNIGTWNVSLIWDLRFNCSPEYWLMERGSCRHNGKPCFGIQPECQLDVISCKNQYFSCACDGASSGSMWLDWKFAIS